MKKNVLIGALVALVGFNPAAANATQIADKEVREHAFLLSLVEQLGVMVTFNGGDCKQEIHGNYYLNGSLLNLCSKGDRADRLDTMRHESWHVLQDLQDCSITDSTPLRSYFGGRGPTAPFKVAAQKHYPTDRVLMEAEAAWGASTFNAIAIANLIIQKGETCGFKFKF